MLNDTAVIDSYNYEDRSSTFFVMHRTDLGWVEQDTLSVPGETSSSFMGFDLSAKTLIAGASFCSEIVLNGGAAHIFSENENGLWVHEAKLTPSDIYEYQYFGRRSVALSGNTALVGGYPVGGDGYAYLFRRDEQCDWTEQFKLVADDTGKWDYFGRSVAICGDALVIGASGDDDAGENAGAVYIYDPVPEPSTTFLLIGLGMVALGTCWKSGK